MSSPVPPQDTLLETLPPSGTPPRTRIKDANAAREIYNRLRKADEESARNRANIDEMFAGAPPYDEQELIATGQGARTNVNFNEAEALLEAALSGYVDLLSSVEILVNFKTRFGSLNERIEWEQTISEELTRMLRGWGNYTPHWLRLATHFVAHGVGIAYFENDYDWRWQIAGLDDFLFPRRTLASESEIEVACCARTMQAQQLYHFIADEERAAKLGWNIEVTKTAIMNAMSNSQNSTWTDWEKAVKELKCNDLHVGIATASEIKVVHVWNVEFDRDGKRGAVTHSIILQDAPASGKDEFLYRRVGKFASMHRAFTTFTYGVGMTGQYHSIRGLGSKIFTEIQLSNRMRCQMADSAFLSSSVLLQPTNEEALQGLQLTYFGPYTILSPGVNIIEKQIPNLGTSAMPVLQDMARLINNRTAGYQASAAELDRTEKTKYQVKSEQADRARLSTSALALFYDPLDRFFREVVRRVCRKGYLPIEPGGQEVAEFRRRCHERGVPLEAIYEVDIARVTAVRAIGAGSEQMRQVTFDEFAQLAPAFDEFGRQMLLRDRVAARIGYQNADRYIQRPTADARPMVDEKFADLENDALLAGNPKPVWPNDNHTIHARVHIAALSQLVQAVEQGQADIVASVPGMVTALEHTTAHVEEMGADPTVQEEAAANRKILSQLTEVVTNSQKHVEKLRREEARQMEQSGGQPPEGGQLPGNEDMDVKLRNRLAEHQVKLDMLRQSAELKMQIRLAESQQKMALEDAKTARRLAAQQP